MTLVRWNPTRSLANFNKMDNWLDEFFNNSWLTESETHISPRTNVEESETEWIVSAELPGTLKEDVSVKFQDGYLTISGEKKAEKEDKGKNYHRIERSYGKFNRSLEIPSSVMVDKIDATFKNGVLSVTLPKAEEAKPKKIEVNIK